MNDLFPQQAEILLEKCFNGKQQPDFNDFDAVLNCVSRMDTVKKLQYRDFSYMINSMEPIMVAADIYFELIPGSAEDPKTGLATKLTYRIYSDELGIRDLKEYIQKCRQEYDSQRNNKLGNDTFFFDQVTAKETSNMQALLFDKKNFETNRTFNNVFFEEKHDVEGRVNHFKNNKAWYTKRGIPYTLGFMFWGRPGTGKCLAADTPIIMYTGAVKLVQHIVDGDRIMGDANEPRIVRGVVQGRDHMYEVQGCTAYTVNSNHILSLELITAYTQVGTQLSWYEDFLQHTRCFSSVQALENHKAQWRANQVGDVVDISIREYMSKSNQWKSHFHGYKRGAVTWWAEKPQELSAHDMGCWLADPLNTAHTVSNKTAPILQCGVPTPTLVQLLVKNRVWHTKHVPHAYKCGSVQQRQQLLRAFTTTRGAQVDVVSSAVVDVDMAFVARSLGYEVQQTVVDNHYNTTYVMAHHTYPITVTGVGTGDYHGFTLDGNGRFTLGDFTVTHNTSTIKAIANVTGRHIINVRLSDVKTNTQLKNLFYSPVLQVMNTDTMQVEKYVVPIHQRLYVIEDIDCMTNLIKRRDPEPVKREERVERVDDDHELENWRDTMMADEKLEMVEEPEQLDRITLDSLLNILDGTLEIPDRMFCITTNHLQVIDEALIRPGRVDMIIEFKFCNREIIKQMFDSFYEQTFAIDLFNKIKDYKVSPAVVNQVLFKHFTRPVAAIEELTTMANKRKNYKKKPEDE